MTGADLIDALLRRQVYDQPIEIETQFGDRLEITRVDQVGWGIVLHAEAPVVERGQYDELWRDLQETVRKVRTAFDRIREAQAISPLVGPQKFLAAERAVDFAVTAIDEMSDEYQLGVGR